MAMDMLRAGYHVRMRMRSDSAEETPVVWCRCEPTAKFFPERHRYASLNWNDPDAERDLGEQSSRPRRFYDGRLPVPWAGVDYDGPLRAFQQGAVASDPLLELGEDGYPLGCLEVPSGIVVGGRAIQGGGYVLISTGGVLVDGTGFPPPPSAALLVVESLAAQALVERRATAALAVVESLAAVGHLLANATASLLAVENLAASSSVERAGIAALAVVESLAAAGQVLRRASASLAVVESLAAAGRVERAGTAALAAVESLLADGTLLLAGTAPLSVLESLTAASQVLRQATAALAALESVTAQGLVERRAMAALAAVESLTAGGLVERLATAALAAVETLTADGSVLVALTSFTNGTIAAAGSTQAAATLIASDSVRITSATIITATGVLLPAPTSSVGYRICVRNDTSISCTVYPNSGAKIGGGATNAGVSLAQGAAAFFVGLSATQWDEITGLV